MQAVNMQVDQSATAGLAGRLSRIARRYPSAAIGCVVLAVMILVGILAPFLGTVSPNELSLSRRLLPPSESAWFGTDGFGRDIYSRVLYGTHVSLFIGFTVAVLSAGIGLLVGLISGFVRPLDAVLMRITDGLMSIPSILLAIALMALIRGSVTTVIVAITIAEVPRVTRLVRSVVLTLREQVYVEAAVASGVRVPSIILRHILPNTVAPMMVQATYIFASAMIIEAALSFIGAGVPPDVPTWGNIMADGRSLWQIQASIVFIPAAFLSVTVLAVNMMGDGLRDALDPRLKRRV
ncbi:putative peptide ABC transporter permease protein y4tQ [Hyphomicrobiales bacterium]|nr:putative peptide ABC transporter permease protein y4tQ [Hyphomicrobiales bacterium]